MFSIGSILFLGGFIGLLMSVVYEYLGHMSGYDISGSFDVVMMCLSGVLVVIGVLIWLWGLFKSESE